MEAAREAFAGRKNTQGIRSLSPVWLAGPVSTGLGLAAHLAAGGQAPAVLIVVALAALLGMGASMLGTRRLPAWGVLLTAALAQQLLHLAFAAFSTAGGFSLAGHGHGETALQEASNPAGPAPDSSSHDLHLMLHLHVGAALVVMVLVTQWMKMGSMLKRLPSLLNRPGR
ncbi:hypothetical protein [Pseudarthrobacter sp. NamE5]|uniref:hypothetical protein n=1 Tax=Pseudarthrobacter sp. NamE5 TaxID=2576839 RepID=UPI00110A331A|nr:hypothetical protein [Pseudarthrobacter sp. NamE5]TLM88032.1 hypothetical protein FDW84_00440 [Pseudarthrobacter sp. NamE5]